MTIVLSEELPKKMEYFSLFETAGWNLDYKASPEELETANRNSWLTLSAFDDDKLVGFGRVVTDLTLHAIIFDLIVLPDYRGRGIGAMVLKALVKKCREKGVRDIQLFCAKDQKGFYEKNGFEARPDDAPGMQLRNSKS
jgi:ribosomal protein S18 acetylase RimI-like enzyme